MNKIELIHALLNINERKQSHEEEYPVVIELIDPSIGPVATANVKTAYAGFDWNHGKIFLSLDKQVMSYNKDMMDRDTPRKVRDYFIDGNIGYCPVCHEEIDSSDKFCSNCGQKLKWE